MLVSPILNDVLANSGLSTSTFIDELAASDLGWWSSSRSSCSDTGATIALARRVENTISVECRFGQDIWLTHHDDVATLHLARLPYIVVSGCVGLRLNSLIDVVLLARPEYVITEALIIHDNRCLLKFLATREHLRN
ncbi:hypothetical protein [Polymorphobacter megasporae]|uniref:hypothetical protein n=1 Tax=Glacieibacterium megasporae TaxID=2835787 RepID=UPI001C1E3569|nr:hypothetical protein [Polymorphobacter megasporae]UAJ10646.1 hypothetical protein KTC28_02500 [Polymorphobacter megasporae]